MGSRTIMSSFLITATLLSAVAACASSDTTPATDSPVTTSTDGESTQHAFEADHFESGAIVGDVATADCTLTGGTVT